MITLVCEHCGKEYESNLDIIPISGQFCSFECARHRIRKKYKKSIHKCRKLFNKPKIKKTAPIKKYTPKPKKAHHINKKQPPVELIQEMLLQGDQKICDKGYIYIEYLGYRDYLHRLIILHNDIEIPKGYGVHHIDCNKLNNNLCNLKVLSWEEHRKLHHIKKVA